MQGHLWKSLHLLITRETCLLNPQFAFKHSKTMNQTMPPPARWGAGAHETLELLEIWAPISACLLPSAGSSPSVPQHTRCQGLPPGAGGLRHSRRGDAFDHLPESERSGLGGLVSAQPCGLLVPGWGRLLICWGWGGRWLGTAGTPTRDPEPQGRFGAGTPEPHPCSNKRSWYGVPTADH